MWACPQGASDRLVNNGSATDKPKKQCKQCGDPFTRTPPRGKPLAMQVNAVLWYLSGLSMNRIAFLLRVSAQAVLAWVRTFAVDHCLEVPRDGRPHHSTVREVLGQREPSFTLITTSLKPSSLILGRHVKCTTRY